MSGGRTGLAAGFAMSAIALPFAIYFSVVVIGTLLGGVGFSLAGKPGARIGSFGGSAAWVILLVLLAFVVGRAIG